MPSSPGRSKRTAAERQLRRAQEASRFNLALRGNLHPLMVEQMDNPGTQPAVFTAPGTAISTAMFETRAVEVIQILADVAELSRAQRRTASELQAERRRLMGSEAALRAECRQAEEMAHRFRAEADDLYKQLHEEKLRCHEERRAARRTYKRYERRLEEQDEEMRCLLERSERHERTQEAKICELTQRLRSADEAEERRAASEVVEAAEAAAAALREVVLLHARAGELREAPDILGGAAASTSVDIGTETKLMVQSSPLASPVTASSADIAAGSPPQPHRRGRFVAEKVSIFERRCQSPQNTIIPTPRCTVGMGGTSSGSIPEALRSGPQGLPVPTPFSGGRRRGDCTSPSIARHAAPPDVPKPPTPMGSFAEPTAAVEQAILGMSPLQP